jgi:Recombinase
MADPERSPLVRRVFEEYATGRFTKEQLLQQAKGWGLTNRRGRPLTSQAIGMLLRNQLYAGIVDVPEYGVRGKRGDFEPLISEDLFYRVQAILSGRLPSTTPQQRAHPRLPATRLRALRVLWSRPHRQLVEGSVRPKVRNAALRRLGPSRTSGSARSGWPVPHRKTR